MPDSPRAFVSYSRADSEFALRLTEDLKAAGANVWLDQLDIEPGTPWDSAIEDALLSSGHLLVILSNVSVTSDNVRDEISYALGQQMKVIPVLYQDCKVPFRLARLQHIDFRNDYPTALKHLLRTLRIAQQTPPPPPPSDPQIEEAQRREEQARLKEEEDRQRQAEDLDRAEERKRAEDRRREEERKQREQAEAARKAAEVPKNDPTRIALEAIRQTLEEPKTQTTETIKPQPPQPKEPAVQTPLPLLTPETTAGSSVGKIFLLAFASGVVRTACGSLIIYLLANFGSYGSVWFVPAITGIISGLVICFVLLRLKPQLAGKLRPVLWAWIVVGIGTSAASFMHATPFSFAGILLFLLIVGAPSAYIGHYLARTLRPSSQWGALIGFIALAVPPLLLQISQRAVYAESVPYRVIGVASFALGMLVSITEVLLLLLFIRNWGQPAQPTV